MRVKKFEKDARTVCKFIQLYCDQKHKDIEKIEKFIELYHEDRNIGNLRYNLCNDCERTLKISYNNLANCPHDEKPSCRKCPTPCYDKSDWKTLAKIMKYSGMQMGLLKIRKLFKRAQV